MLVSIQIKRKCNTVGNIALIKQILFPPLPRLTETF